MDAKYPTIGGVAICEMLEKELRYPIKFSGECWLFTGGAKNGFHGSLYYKGAPWQAHRLAFTLVKGPIPEGMKVLHSCDVGRCVNPDHLFLGTQTDNIADMDAKGRSNRPQPGEKNGRALLSESQVLEIRQLYDEGKSPLTLSETYGVSRSIIYKIGKRESWRHL